MPNIAIPDIDAETWPRDLDDLRAHPGRIVYAHDLARLRIVRTYDTLRHLPAPLRMPGRAKAWEARTILMWLGAQMAVAGTDAAAA